MTRELVTAGPVPQGAAFSPGLAVNGWVFLAGQGGFDPATGELVPGGVEAQTEQALRNVETLLAAAGLTLRDVVSCIVHLSDLSHFRRLQRGVHTGARRGAAARADDGGCIASRRDVDRGHRGRP